MDLLVHRRFDSPEYGMQVIDLDVVFFFFSQCHSETLLFFIHLQNITEASIMVRSTEPYETYGTEDPRVAYREQDGKNAPLKK